METEMEVGSVYQLDHSKLPDKAPGQLRTIRAVMVSKKTEMGIFVAFPSTGSLQAFFVDDGSRANKSTTAGRSSNGLLQPNLDAQYEMGLDVAAKVLFHQIPFEEFAARRGTRSFWIVDDTTATAALPSKEYEASTVMDDGTNEEGSDNQRRNVDLADPCDGGVGGLASMQWGKRRRATSFIGKHKDSRRSPMIISVMGDVKMGDREMEDQVMEKGEYNKEEDWYSGRSELKKRKGRAVFKCEMTMMKNKKMLIDDDHGGGGDAADDDDQKGVKKRNTNKEIKYINPKNRWTEDRYNKAEKNILEVMKAKGAVYGKPILRPELRMEARKLIGDTGLLDHLLKHMAGKLAPGGKERFRRRHNPEGAMEYWLESADLANIRTEAGINDPYWNPPPGWQLGDSPNQDAACAREMKLLKEEVADLKRKLEQMESSRKGENQALASGSQKGSDDHVRSKDASMLMALKVTHEELLKRKAKIDEQLMVVSKALQGMEKDVGKLLELEEAKGKAAGAGGSAAAINEARVALQDKQQEEENEDKAPPAAAKAAPAATAAAAEAEKEARRQRLKSGFRICKPEGTFLWPDMATTTTSTSTCSATNTANAAPAPPPSQQNRHQLLVVVPPPLSVEDYLHGVVPTPPSVSSSTAPPSSRRLSSLPVKPVPERPKVAATTTTNGSSVIKDNSTVSSPCSTTGSCCITTTTFVPDLNEVPTAGDHNQIVGPLSLMTTYEYDHATPPAAVQNAMKTVEVLPKPLAILPPIRSNASEAQVQMCGDAKGQGAGSCCPAASPAAAAVAEGGIIGCWRVQVTPTTLPLLDHNTS